MLPGTEHLEGTIVFAQCGMSDVAALARDHRLSGLELATLAGSVGGAVWMNARCYDRQMSDVLEYVEFLDAQGAVRREKIDPGQMGLQELTVQRRRAILGAGADAAGARRRKPSPRPWRRTGRAARKGALPSSVRGKRIQEHKGFGAPHESYSRPEENRWRADRAVSREHHHQHDRGHRVRRVVLILVMEEEVQQKDSGSAWKEKSSWSESAAEAHGSEWDPHRE